MATTAQAAPPSADPPTAAVRRTGIWDFVGRYAAITVLVAMIVMFALLQPDEFATKSNIINILNQSALTALIAMGITFPLVAGDFDLSIGYAASLGGIVALSLMQNEGASIPVGISAAILVGILIGMVNGAIVTKVGVNPLVATLGIGTVVLGLSYAITNGQPVVLVDNAPAYIDLTLGTLWGIPYPVYMMFGAAIVLWILLNRTVVGQAMQAVGGNAEAARLSGVRVDRIRIYAYVIAGVCAVLTGVLLASRTGSAAVNSGDSYLLSAFAAAFFGSAVLREGQFHIVGTLLGVITVAIGFNGMALMNLNTYYQYLFQGLLLIFAVGLGTLARRRATR